MADDLDALFGAFDGNDGGAAVGNNEKESNVKKASEDGEDGEEGEEKEDGEEEGEMEEEKKDEKKEEKEEEKGSKDEMEAASKGEGNEGPLYTEVMAKPSTAASFQSSVESIKEKKSDKATEGREVATGTSHDKSIRSYSARPDALHPKQENDPSSTPSGEEEKARKPAKTYPFELDPFQKEAISFVERGESVLVAAHTSAGKTAVAEYAVAKSLQNGQRVVYTSPIKALSNQKYRDLAEEFDSVGLMTGDITINKDATCLVMTTEILRSMLYRGSELMREVAWVIYDEVHYMRDKERGVVWEESIILLPHKVRFVFLSATIPNAKQFVHWICKIHHQPCHVVYTNYRPVPLQHYIFPNGGDGLHLVVDEKGKFREANFQRAMATLQSSSSNPSDGPSTSTDLSGGAGGGNSRKRKRQRSGGNNAKSQMDLHRIVKLVMERNLNPVIVFSFSKKDCERYALALIREDYTDEVEKDLISQVYHNAIESLKEDDQKLPQVEALLPLLKRGIGIHHGGLLPILKEIVEILFSEGLIKALFATETFAIGINMPAKTVVFTTTRKWDGRDFRWLTSGEYIQMSGRAGRRGKDDRGIVIQMINEQMEPDVCKGILYGDPDPLNSSYRISYNMLLNLMRVEDVDPEYLLRASFHQYQQESEAPELERLADETLEKAKGIVIEDESTVAEYYQMDVQLGLTQRRMMKIVRRPEYILPFLQSKGRVLDITIQGQNYGWGVLTSYKNTAHLGSAGSAGKLLTGSAGQPQHSLYVLLNCVERSFDVAASNKNDRNASSSESKRNNKKSSSTSNINDLLWRGTIEHCRPARSSDHPNNIHMRVFTVDLDCIDRISAVRLFPPQDLHAPEARAHMAKSVAEVIRRFPEGVPLLDPVKDMKITSEEFHTLLKRASTLKSRLASHSLMATSSDADDVSEKERAHQLKQYGTKTQLLEDVKTLRRKAKACQTVVMKDELRQMKRVLRRLGHIDSNSVLQRKGIAACEINTADELVVVELVFSGVFNDISTEQCVALLSCLTFDERNKEDDDPAQGMKRYLSNPFSKMKDVARTVARAVIACKLEMDEDEFVDKFNPGMMEAVFAWCKGAKFVDVQKLTGTFEGTTIRTLRRLEELVRQLASASKAIGNHELEEKFEKGRDMLKRDIVFCSSLYL